MNWSAGFRFLIVGLLAVAMFIPLLLVSTVIEERTHLARMVRADIGEEWGGAQRLFGPVLVIPVEGPVERVETRESVDPETGERVMRSVTVTETVRKASLRLMPENFAAIVETQTEERHRGIFTVPVYSAEADIRVDFSLTDTALNLEPGEVLLWDKARLELLLSANRALRGATTLRIDGREVMLDPLQESDRAGVVARIGDPRGLEDFRLGIALNGAETFLIVPAGRNSEIQIASDWPHPSFTGAFLPDNSEIGAFGFTAQWTISHLARSLPQATRSGPHTPPVADAFGVHFFQPNDFYQKAYRMARYGILFVSFTFLLVLLIERVGAQKVHPVQYVMIGLAQSVFALLMLAYAEHIGFTSAYVLASVATGGLITLYAKIGLRFGRRSLVLASALTVLYAVLYLILESADYALLAGATLAFLSLGLTMVVTRNESWFGHGKQEMRAPLRPGAGG